MNPKNNRTYQFGEFTLDVADRRLERGGEAIHLQPKTFDTLVRLIELRGRVVTKQELLDTLWAGTCVTQNALTRCIKEARKSLGDDATDPAFIRTVSRVGYRFIATTRELETERSATRRPRLIPFSDQRSVPVQRTGSASRYGRRFALLTALTGLAAIGVALAIWLQPPAPQEERPRAYNTIAVLPFVNMSDDPGNEYLSDGISEDLLNKLAELPDLRVSARTSAFFFKGKQVDISTIAERLDVATIVEGSVRRHGDKVRITAQLIDTNDGYHLWSDTYDREVGDVFAVQDEIAESIARALQTILPSVVGASTYRPDLGAYQLYLRGRETIHRRPADWIPRSVQYFSKAIEADPAFAEPYAARAISNAISILHGGEPDAETEFGMVRKALELKPDLPEAHAALGLLHQSQSDFLDAEDAFRRAIDLNPNFSSARSWLASVLGQTRRFAESHSEMMTALRTDPLDPLVNANSANVLSRTGKYDEAISLLQGWLEFPPAPPMVDFEMVRVNASYGHYDQSMSWAHDILADHPEWTLPHVYLVSGYARLGDLDNAAAALAALERFDRSTRTFLSRAEYLFISGDVAGLRAHMNTQADVDPKPWSLVYWSGISSLLSGDSATAIETLRWIDQTRGHPIPSGMFVTDEVEFLLWLAAAYRANAEHELATETAGRALRILEGMSDQGFRFPAFLRMTAQAHAQLGDREAAIAALTAAVDIGWRNYWATVHDSRWDGVRADESFAALMKRVQSDVEIMRGRVNRAAANDDWPSLRITDRNAEAALASPPGSSSL